MSRFYLGLFCVLALAGCGDSQSADIDARVDGRPGDGPNVDAPDGPSSCMTPLELVFANGVAAVVANTGMASDHGAATCGGAGGPDLVYRFTTPTAGTLTVDVRPTQGSPRAVVSVRSACEASASEVLGACVVAQSAAANALLTLPNLGAGTYYLWLDSADPTQGTLDVSLTLSAARGEACADPSPLVFGSGEVNAGGSTLGRTDDDSGACGGAGASDAVYRFDLTSASNLEVTVTPRVPTLQPVVYLQSTTCAGTERGCAAAGSPGANALLRLGNLAPDSYFLWIDGTTPNPGAYQLTARLSAPLPGDVCTAPKPLMLSNGQAGGTASDSGDTSAFFPDATGSCVPGTGADVVYSFTTNATLDLRATVSTTSSSFRPALYLRAGSCTGTEQGCGLAPAAGGTASLALPALPAGTYYLFIDGAAGTLGPYALQVSLTTPQPGDGCTSPIPLVFSNGAAGGMASASGDTTSFFNNASGSCNAGTAPDLVYSFTTNVVLDLQASLSTTSTTFRPALYLRTGSCTGSQLVCGVAAAAGGTASITQLSLPAGTHFLWVDGATTTAGPFGLSANLTPLPAEEVRPRALSDVAVPGPMTVAYDVVNRFGNVVTTDSSTQFTVTATGSAVFSGATQGTINSGMGTNSVLVTVSSGAVVLAATDTTAETVTYAAIDSQANGLRYPGATATQTTSVQALNCSTTRINNFAFTFAQRPAGNGTLTVYARGDFDASTEYMDVYMETTAGTRYGSLFVTGAQCPTSYLMGSLTIPQADLTTYLSDGVAGVATVTSISVGCFCAPNDAYMTLSFPISNSARFF